MGPCVQLDSGKSPGPFCRNAGPVKGIFELGLVLCPLGRGAETRVEPLLVPSKNLAVLTVIHMVFSTNRTGLIPCNPKIFSF